MLALGLTTSAQAMAILRVEEKDRSETAQGKTSSTQENAPLDTRERVGSLEEDLEPSGEATDSTRDGVGGKRSRVLPVSETDPVVGGVTSKVDDEPSDDQTCKARGGTFQSCYRKREGRVRTHRR